MVASPLPDGRLECRLCPRFCKLNEGQRGFCFVRKRLDDQIVLTTYGRSSGFCIDPIEKKPLNHFLPGTSVLSFGTAGCNLGCRFCQNWDISKAREWDKLADAASPEEIAREARSMAADRSHLPTTILSFSLNTRSTSRKRAVSRASERSPSPQVTSPPKLAPTFTSTWTPRMWISKPSQTIFTTDFASPASAPVLETLKFLKETDVWFEVTTLLIPDENDSDAGDSSRRGVVRRKPRT